MSRRDHNDKILQLLASYLGKYPDQRFGQALVNLDVLVQQFDGYTMATQDPFYEESETILLRMSQAYAKMQESND